jgi:hypothetical protein
MTGTHLSFLALDGIRLGRPQDAGERAHLADCAACAGYLQAAEPAPLPRPDWLSGAALAGALKDRAGASVRVDRARRSWFWLLALAPAAGAAALWLVALHPGPRPGETPAAAPGAATLKQGTREKGTPAVRVFVKRDERVFVWDGKRPVRPDDRLRLEVHRAGYRFVSVAGLPRSGLPPQILYQGPLDRGGPLLPISFRVDDRGTEEVLSVILGRAPVPEQLHALAGPPDGEAETWRQILLLEKRSRGAEAASPPETLRGRPGTLSGSQK